MKQIITSLLDTDLYIFTMMDFIYTNCPNAKVKYKFICRNKDVKLGFLAEELNDQIQGISNLRFKLDEIKYLRGLRYLHANFLNFLTYHQLSSSDVFINNVDGDLSIEIGVSEWIDIIMWEVPLLATINELYFQSIKDTSVESFNVDGIPVWGRIDYEEIGNENLNNDIILLNAHPQLYLSEFGTRRRFSKEWQDHVVLRLKTETNNLVGTSNVYLAMKHGLKPIGTMAHCLISAYLGLVDNIEIAQRTVLYQWLAHFDTMNGPDLGIALTDTFGTNAFLSDFKHTLAHAYSGVRHDSGSPYVFGEKIIEHYKNVGIDPRTKTIVFSNSLKISDCVKIFETFTGKIGIAFGVGTSLTNSVGFYPLNIVIKLIECNGTKCVKLSDDPSKAIGDLHMIERVKIAYKIGEQK